MLTGLLAISAECFRPRSGYLADVSEICVLLMIPAGPRVRQPEMQTAAGRMRPTGGGGMVHRG